MSNKRVSLDVASSSPNPPPASAASPPADQGQTLEERIIAAMKTCFDPEIPVNIYELGLIYKLDIDPANDVHIKMTLTSPGCPVAGVLPKDVQARVQAVDGVKSVNVEVVWDPPWDKSMMSEAAMLELGLF